MPPRKQQKLTAPPSKVILWITAARPKTLTITATPVLTGTLLAFTTNGTFSITIFLATFFAAILIQIGANFYNDSADSLKGNDGKERCGPLRVTAQGWTSAKHVTKAALISFSLAAILGLYLIWIGGVPIFFLGLTSIIAGIIYSAGPLPLSHTPLGEIFALVFFGIATVCGTVFLQTGAFQTNSLTIGTALGLFAAAVLFVNNTRDIKEDTRAGRRTLSILIGRKKSNFIYGAILIIPYLLILISPYGWFPLLSAPFAIFLIKNFIVAQKEDFNKVLVQTVQLQLFYALLLCTEILL